MRPSYTPGATTVLEGSESICLKRVAPEGWSLGETWPLVDMVAGVVLELCSSWAAACRVYPVEFDALLVRFVYGRKKLKRKLQANENTYTYTYL